MLNAYVAILFLHIACAIGFVVGLGIIYCCVSGLRRARTPLAFRLWARLATRVTRTLVPLAGGGTVVCGLILWAMAWQDAGSWALVAFGTFFLVGLVTGAFQGRWIAVLGARVAQVPDEGALPVDVARAAQAPQLVLTTNVTLSVVAGVLLLMVTKPDVLTSLIVVGGALVVGLLVALFLIARTRAMRTRNVPSVVA